MNTFIKIILGLILLSGCTYETSDLITEEDDMSGNHRKTKLEDKEGWQATGFLTRHNKANPVGGNGVSCAANFKEPGNYTVQFDMKPSIDNESLYGSARAEAEIIWSVEGNDVRRLVTMGKGMSVSGTGQGVKVIVRDVSTLNGGTGTYQYQVDILVARGTRPSQQQPPILEADGMITLAPGGLTSIDVPVNAGVISLSVPFSGAGADLFDDIPQFKFLVKHVDGNGNIQKIYDPRFNQFEPLSPGTTLVLFASDAAAPNINFKPVWGIDG